MVHCPFKMHNFLWGVHKQIFKTYGALFWSTWERASKPLDLFIYCGTYNCTYNFNHHFFVSYSLCIFFYISFLFSFILYLFKPIPSIIFLPIDCRTQGIYYPHTHCSLCSSMSTWPLAWWSTINHTECVQMGKKPNKLPTSGNEKGLKPH